MKKRSTLFIIITLFMIGCTSTQKVVDIPTKYIPQYDFTPPQRNEPLSAGVTIGLLNPTFINGRKNKSLKQPPYTTFINNMGDDFEEMLIAKGFSLRGPFATRDEMVYGDKKDTDLMIEISINMEEEAGTIAFKRRTTAAHIADPNKKPYYTVSGTFFQFGNIVLEATDPTTGEKFWKKSIALPRTEIMLNGTKTFRNGKPTQAEIMSDLGVYNPIAKALEKYYQDAISTAWKHIDAEEMKLIKQQIQNSKK